ncbi:IS66 family transposase [Chondromyces apiculatus]|uniref:Uncharacterized protein n=1 Tax=Chondromyces apiculatus DSM 436 TaxID=1192034 RepID=A0A017STR2_9BACT|nr:IS66 family transposase [Chondromyces apiculatus]EYE99984.1 Hypothetical protein CAP_1865 [Chondromyces apiculatus DSM 436]
MSEKSTASESAGVEALRELREQLLQRDDAIAALRELVRSLEGTEQALKTTLANQIAENEQLKRRLFGTKSERTNTSEFQLLLEGLFRENAALQKKLEQELTPGGATGCGDDGAEKGRDKEEKKARPKPKGRRNLAASHLPRITVDIDDPELAKKGRLIGYEPVFELLRIPGSFRVLEKRIARYESALAGTETVLSAELPPRLFPRALCHTSVFAWLAIEKFMLGVPCYRLEQLLQTEEASLDRGTMCRYLEDLGGTLGATVVHAMFEDARANCHVLSTDATGAAIQPEPGSDGRRRACKKGHFFTIVADCDHVLYHYTQSHSSASVEGLFHGFSGLLQSDASSVYDILDRGPPGQLAEATEDTLKLVGCWAHCRRYFFDAAVTKHQGAVEGLRRIRELYALDAQWSKLPPSERKRRRATHLAPLLDGFFAWVSAARASQAGRSLAAKALGYAHNQEHELRRILTDGRLPLDNTRSERALRTIVVGRKNWLFYGSDTHAESAAALFTIIASCRLHRLDPLATLNDVLRVLPYWPKERYLELAPSNWAATRARLDADQLAAPVGVIRIPPGT